MYSPIKLIESSRFTMDIISPEISFIFPFFSKNSSFFISVKKSFHSSEFGSSLIFKYSLYFFISSLEISFFTPTTFTFSLFLLSFLLLQDTTTNKAVIPIKKYFFNFISFTSKFLYLY